MNNETHKYIGNEPFTNWARATVTRPDDWPNDGSTFEFAHHMIWDAKELCYVEYHAYVGFDTETTELFIHVTRVGPMNHTNKLIHAIEYVELTIVETIEGAKAVCNWLMMQWLATGVEVPFDANEPYGGPDDLVTYIDDKLNKLTDTNPPMGD